MLEEIQEAAEVTTPDKIKKKWRAKVENKTLDPTDLINYFQLSASYFLTVSRKDNASDVGESHKLFSCTLFSWENLKYPKGKFAVETKRKLISISISVFECASRVTRGLSIKSSTIHNKLLAFVAANNIEHMCCPVNSIEALVSSSLSSLRIAQNVFVASTVKILLVVTQLNHRRVSLLLFLGTCIFDEEGAKVAIIDIVQELILGARWEETLNKLKAGNNVSSVCGSIFKNGEPTYS